MHPYKRFCLVALLILLSKITFSQAAVLLPMPRQCFNDNLSSGKPLAGGLLYTCVAGTSCPGNPLATFTDSTGTVQNSNPLALDAAGCASVWLKNGVGYKIVAQNSMGVQEWSADNVSGLAGSLGSSLAASTSVSFSATPSFISLAQNQLFKMTLTDNVASSSLVMSGLAAPALVTFEIAQDGTGSRTFAWPTTTFAASPVSSCANCTTIETFSWDGSTALLLSAFYNNSGTGIQVGNLFTGVFSSTAGGNVLAGSGNQFTAQFIQSQTANSALSGFLRIAAGDSLCWRNTANSGDNCFTQNGANQIIFNGFQLASLNGAQIWTANQNFNAGTFFLNGPVSNSLGLSPASSTPSGTLLMPSPVGAGIARQTIAQGTAALGTTLLGTSICGDAATITTVTGSLTNVTTSDVLSWSQTSASGFYANGLSLQGNTSAGAIAIEWCNPSATVGVTPGAMTVNWAVTR